MTHNPKPRSSAQKTSSASANRRSMRLLLAIAALATASLAMPATAQKSAAAPTSKNWMREYVALRVAEKNMQYLPAGTTPEEMDRMVQPRIVGGSIAGAKDNPFQVALLTKRVSDNFDAQFCGGTLIRPNVVVTAAHCSDFTTADKVQVLTGTRNLDGTGVRRDVKRISIHPNWNANTFDSDVAVWVLTSSANGIPLATLAKSSGPIGGNLLVTGWGALTEDGDYPINLRKVLVPKVFRDKCNDAGSYSGDITRNMMCAGLDRGGVDSCQGDSGGPLTRGAGNSELAGIVSWGNGCARPNFYGVYTRISSPSITNFINVSANKP